MLNIYNCLKNFEFITGYKCKMVVGKIEQNKLIRFLNKNAWIVHGAI